MAFIVTVEDFLIVLVIHTLANLCSNPKEVIAVFSLALMAQPTAP